MDTICDVRGAQKLGALRPQSFWSSDNALETAGVCHICHNMQLSKRDVTHSTSWTFPRDFPVYPKRVGRDPEGTVEPPSSRSPIESSSGELGPSMELTYCLLKNGCWETNLSFWVFAYFRGWETINLGLLPTNKLNFNMFLTTKS